MSQFFTPPPYPNLQVLTVTMIDDDQPIICDSYARAPVIAKPPTASQCSCSEDAVQAAKEAVQAAKDAEQAKQAAATLMEEYERRKLSAAASESASSGLSLGQTIGVAVGCSLAVVLLVALGLFVLMRGRRKGPSATNEAASGVQLKAETQVI